MKVLFVPLAGITHYFHLVPLAWALRAAGHEVRVAARPPVEAITDTGMTAVPVGGGYDFTAGLAEAHMSIQRRLGRAPKPGDLATLPPETVREFRETRVTPHIRAAEAMAAELVPFARAWKPDLVVGLPIVLAAPLAAAAAGAPLVRHLWGPDISRQAGFPGLGSPVEEWPEALLKLYREYGVEPEPDHAVRTIDPCPADLQIPLPARLPVRYVPYNGSGAVPAWLRELPAKRDRPRVCVTWSTLNTSLVGSDGFAVPEILRALAGLDVEIIATVQKGDLGMLGDVPDGVRLVDPVPHGLLLPHCDAVVHHGGAGTVLTALHYGLPQVIVPPVADQVFNAGLVAATGAGLSLHADQTDVDQIKVAVARVLDEPGPREAAGRLRAEMLAQPAPAELVPVLEELV